MAADLTPAQRLRQARLKWNIIAKREVRAQLPTGCITGNFNTRMLLDTIERTYEAGRQAGIAETRGQTNEH